MIRSSFEPELCCWVTRCTVRGCNAHVTGRTPDELHDEACALGWTVRHGRGPLCPEHREYTAPPRKAVEILRSMIERGRLSDSVTARAMLREWEAS